MNGYPNVNKPINIESINSQKMILQDGSQWEFMGADRPSALWQAGDVVVVRKPEENSPYQTQYGITNKTRKDREISVVYAGGGISEEEITRINKSWNSEEYPSERLGKVWKIKELLEDGSILLEDCSVWHLINFTNKGEDNGEWAIRQNVRITKGSSGIGYGIENLDINRLPFIASFLGFQ